MINHDHERFVEFNVPLAENRTLQVAREHSYLAHHPDHGATVDLIPVEDSVQLAIPVVGADGLRSMGDSLHAAAIR